MKSTDTPAPSSTLDSTLKAAYELLQAGRIDEAERLCQGLLALTPNVKTAVLASAIAEARPDLPRALEIVNAAIEHHGEKAELLLKQAQVLMQLRRRVEGVAAARRAAEICPPDARLLQAIARIHLERNEPAEAQPLLQRARELLPTDPTILYDSALCHCDLNEIDEAATLLERVLTLAPGNGFALYLRSQLRTQTAEKNNVEYLRATLMYQQIRKQDAISAYFALSKELEDIGEFQESFAALSEGNRIKRSTLDYHVRNDLDAMQKVMAHYTGDALANAAGGEPASGPIFIVGMPRTGMTLVERVLGSHADVVSLGALVDFPIDMAVLAERVYVSTGSTDSDLLRASLQVDFAELGRNYLQAVQPLAGGRRHFVDKLPFNFRYCGLIHQALPNAKIVHLTRDPLDTCYAAYKTLFVNAYHCSYQLDELVQFYIAYRRTMAHWHAVMPGVICDVSYEDLVADPSAQCRRLLKWCGLPWQDDLLDFHQSRVASTTAGAAQVRQLIYTSAVKKWRNFEKQLQPVVRRLAEAGLVDAEGNPLPWPTPG